MTGCMPDKTHLRRGIYKKSSHARCLCNRKANLTAHRTVKLARFWRIRLLQINDGTFYAPRAFFVFSFKQIFAGAGSRFVIN